MSVMYSGHQLYSIEMARFTFVELPTFDFAFPNFPSVEKVELSSPTPMKIDIKIVFKDVLSPDDADSFSSVIAFHIADKLAFLYKISVSAPIRGEVILHDSLGRGIGAVSMNCSTSGYSSTPITPAELPQLMTWLRSSEPSREAYYSMFRNYMAYDGTVSRFMYLYGLLVALKGPSQRKVDAFIMSIEQASGVLMFSSHAQRHETIYTHLRNQVGHPDPANPMQNVSTQMDLHLDKLADHVKTAISQIP